MHLNVGKSSAEGTPAKASLEVQEIGQPESNQDEETKETEAL